MWGYEFDWAGPWSALLKASCEDRNETAGFMKRREFLDWLRDQQPPKKDSFPWSSQVTPSDSVYQAYEKTSSSKMKL
jgi:hypothetical protein